jgi:hypothetical protein
LLQASAILFGAFRRIIAAQRQTDTFLRPEQIAEHRLGMPGDVFEQQCRPAIVQDATRNFGHFELRADGSTNSLQFSARFQ